MFHVDRIGVIRVNLPWPALLLRALMALCAEGKESKPKHAPNSVASVSLLLLSALSLPHGESR